jgi:hypothetical protein
MAFNLIAGIRAKLLENAAIAAIVGDRIHPTKAPQGIVDSYILLLLPGFGLPAPVIKGQPTLRGPVLQVDCYVREKSGVEAGLVAATLGNLVRDELEGYAGDLVDDSGSPTLTVHAGIAPLETEPRHEYETDEVGGWYRHLAEYRIGHDAR